MRRRHLPTKLPECCRVFRAGLVILRVGETQILQVLSLYTFLGVKTPRPSIAKNEVSA